MTEFNLRKEREKLFEEELVGKIASAGRIYRKIIAQDKEFIAITEDIIYSPFISIPEKLIKFKKLAGNKLVKEDLKDE